MRRREYCCDASRHLYENYYLSQTGDGLPVFYGSRGQRGHGLGSLLGGLFRSAMPMIKRGLAAFGKHALKTGLEVANDVVAGDSIKDSAKKRIPQAIKRFASGALSQSGSGYGKRRRQASKKRKTSKRRRKVTTKRRKKAVDIFD